MKVIDLYNKIANGEEVPSEIKYRNKIFVYDKDNQCYIVENYNEYGDLLMSLSNHKGTDLNYEIEILEEPKGIPEKLESYISCGWNGTCKDLKREELFEDLKKIGSKINEIIEYLEYLESKGQ